MVHRHGLSRLGRHEELRRLTNDRGKSTIMLAQLPPLPELLGLGTIADLTSVASFKLCSLFFLLAGRGARGYAGPARNPCIGGTG